MKDPLPAYPTACCQKRRWWTTHAFGVCSFEHISCSAGYHIISHGLNPLIWSSIHPSSIYSRTVGQGVPKKALLKCFTQFDSWCLNVLVHLQCKDLDGLQINEDSIVQLKVTKEKGQMGSSPGLKDWPPTWAYLGSNYRIQKATSQLSKVVFSELDHVHRKLAS